MKINHLFLIALSVLAFMAGTGYTVARTGTAIVSGTVKDTSSRPVANATIKIGKIKTSTSEDGSFRLDVPVGKPAKLEVSYSGFVRKSFDIPALGDGENYTLNAIISLEYTVNTVDINYKKRDAIMMKIVKPQEFELQPNTSGGVESIIKMLAGVSSNNELSSQYNVRGGNYDENLVYINDIEIYRPQLANAGAQEGLSIINSDMVDYLQFSAGGFEAKYGDKMSSVLDIHYKEPDSFFARFNASLLGGGLTLAGASDNHRFRYMVGARYRTNQYLLNSLNVQGNYQPSFTDVQSYLSYDITEKLNISLLSYYGHNRYLSQPVSQSTSFGTATQSFQLNVLYFGQEIFEYNTFLNGLTLNYQPNSHTTYKFINSFYLNDERQLEDIGGNYQLGQLDNDPTSKTYGKVKNLIGSGEYFNHARDILNYTIFNSEIKGYHNDSNNLHLEWGLKFQHEYIQEELSDYKEIDSGGYSTPHDTVLGSHSPLNLYKYVYSQNTSAWNRYMAYIQNSWVLSKNYNTNLVLGVRANHWDYTGETVVSPRFLLYTEPFAKYNRHLAYQNLPDTTYKKLAKNKWRLKAAAGVYSQPPFFREIINQYGVLNPEIRAQKSAQFVLGSDNYFSLWNRPFKLTAEAYYKYLWDIIPYEIDDVQIRYFGENQAKGYTTGLDFQLNGEFVKENPSWVSLSFLKAREDINGDSYTQTDANTGVRKVIHPGYIPRPSDQLMRFSLYFQDYLPGRPKYRVHLNFVFATGLPFGPPDYKRYKDTLRYPSYYRTDIGFSRVIYDRSKMGPRRGFFKYVRNMALSAEVFNLFNINNTISYLWVQDIQGNQWAIPNYLTSRRINISLQIKF